MTQGVPRVATPGRLEGDERGDQPFPISSSTSPVEAGGTSGGGSGGSVPVQIRAGSSRIWRGAWRWRLAAGERSALRWAGDGRGDSLTLWSCSRRRRQRPSCVDVSVGGCGRRMLRQRGRLHRHARAASRCGRRILGGQRRSAARSRWSRSQRQCRRVSAVVWW